MEWVKLGISCLLCRLILMSTSACLIDYPKRGCVHGHISDITFLNFGENTKNILETVQDRDISAMDNL